MADYWKSIVSCLCTNLPVEPPLTLGSKPKYWCKHCKTFVRDTPLEKNNHEATLRHQGNLKRFLRDLHRDNETAEREKQRAKDEVARLNGAQTTSVSSHAPTPKPAAPSASALRNAAPEERRRQMTQLAEMGVAVPEDYRRENAMAGDWEMTWKSREAQAEAMKVEDDKAAINLGVRKRKVEGEELEVQREGERKRRNWGSDMKTLPGDDQDLDALLGATTTIKPREVKKEDAQVKSEELPTKSEDPPAKLEERPMKREDGLDSEVDGSEASHALTTTVQAEAGVPDVGSMFKKRKAKLKK